MKIAFVGKGGSGKTTLCALTGKTLASLGFPVLLIDADINQHLGNNLGISEAALKNLPTLGLNMDSLKEYFRGTNARITNNQEMIKTTPPGNGSAFINFATKNPIFSRFAHQENNLLFMAVGPFDESDLGTKCYHSKTGSVEMILNHFLDQKKEYILVDMTAGADSFASGLFTRFDMTILVVEPTVKSVSVYHQYKEYAKNFGVKIKVVGNKIENQDDIDFIKDQVGEDLIAIVNQSAFIKQIDKGKKLPIHHLEKENTKAIHNIIAITDLQEKDWDTFYRQAIEFHIKNSHAWGNKATGKDLTQQIDPHFKISDAISN